MIATIFSIVLMGSILIFALMALRHFKSELKKDTEPSHKTH